MSELGIFLSADHAFSDLDMKRYKADKLFHHLRAPLLNRTSTSTILRKVLQWKMLSQSVLKWRTRAPLANVESWTLSYGQGWNYAWGS